MDKAELKAAIVRVEEWAARLESNSARPLKTEIDLILAAARSTIEPEPCSCGRCLECEARDYHSSKPIPVGETATIFVPLMLDGTTNVGRLGATVSERASREYAQGAALDMAERRILRIEHALKVSGIDVDILGLGE